MEFFLSPGMAPFSGALMALVALVLLEICLLMAGLGSAGVSEAGDIGDAGDTDVAAEAEGAIGKALAFVGFGRVPAMVVLMVLAATFGIAGMLLQLASSSLAGAGLPLLLAVPLAGAAAVMSTARIARGIARLLPADETSAVRADSLIGSVATVMSGTATTRTVAPARVRDANGGLHHIQVRARDPGDAFATGDEVLLFSRDGGFFIGVTAPSDHQ